MKTNNLQTAGRIARAISFIILALLLTQCKGPRGENGIDGINYTHSVIYDVSTSSWTGNADGYSATLNVPEITDDIYYNGAVLVYRLIEVAPKSFNMLPYTYVDNTYVSYLDYNVYTGSIELLLKEVSEGVNSTVAPEATMSFKVVIIEGINLEGLKTIVDPHNYHAVSRLLNLDRKVTE
jgi:hypothetical protein